MSGKQEITIVVKERLLFMDLAKFIAILCVCIGHVYAMSSLNNGGSILNRCIYSFHMPLFMLLCGFFAVSSLSLDFSSFIKKKAKTLLLPALTFTMLSSIVITCFGGVNWSRYINEAIGGMWFLRTVFFCYLIFYIAKQTKLPDYLCCLFSCLLVMFIPHGWYLQTNFLLLFFWSGYFLKKYWWGGYYCHRGLLTILSALFYVFFGRIDTISVITPKVLINDMMLLPIQYLTGLAASLVVIGISSYFSSCWHLDTNSLMPTIGKYTLGIYGVQTILLERITGSLFHISVPDGWTALYDFAVIPAIGLFFCLLSYYVVRLTAKNHIMNIFLYGGMYK